MDVTNLAIIILCILLVLMTVPIGMVIYYLKNHVRLAPRIMIDEFRESELWATYQLNERNFDFPVIDISMTGLAFVVEDLGQLYIEKEMPLKLRLSNGQLIDVLSEIVYVKNNWKGIGGCRVGVKFLAPLSNQLMFSILEERGEQVESLAKVA
jgi:hypothetical protein